jgi:hypothetical protein
MEVGQGPNVGCSAKGRKKIFKHIYVYAFVAIESLAPDFKNGAPNPSFMRWVFIPDIPSQRETNGCHLPALNPAPLVSTSLSSSLSSF